MFITVRPRRAGLWRNRDFMALWTGQTVSAFGSLVGGFALDLAAIIVLHATPLQITILLAANLLPGLAIGLFAGVWVDRLRRRPILIAADLGRAVLLGSIPLAAVLHLLRIEQLYVVALLTSVCTMAFEVAYRSYLPSLVAPDALVEGNSLLQASDSVAELAGFGAAGILVQALTAPIAILVDALSFLASACSVALIRTPELRSTTEDAASRDTWQEIAQGVRFVWSHPAVRAVTGATATLYLFRDMVGVVIMLYFVRVLHLTAALMGPLFAVGAVGSLAGAAVAARVVRRWGAGRTFVGALILNTLGGLCIPFAGGPLWLIVVLLAAAQLCDAAATIYEINVVSLRQAHTPAEMQGRVNACAHVVEGGAQLAGLLLGGVLGGVIGLRSTLLVGILGAALAVPWIVFSPLRAPETPHEE